MDVAYNKNKYKEIVARQNVYSQPNQLNPETACLFAGKI
jgi:hypothetical protein